MRWPSKHYLVRKREVVDQRKQWQRWFAWRPVRFDSCTYVWLEWVERRAHFSIRDHELLYWEYRE